MVFRCYDGFVVVSSTRNSKFGPLFIFVTMKTVILEVYLNLT